MTKQDLPQLKILIIDDMASMRVLIKHYLRSYEAVSVIGEASEGEEGLKKAEEYKPDVIILDVSLPGGSGVEISRKIKSFLPNCHVYLCSAYELNEYKELKLDSPADGFIQKSCMKAELHAMIQKELVRNNILNTQI